MTKVDIPTQDEDGVRIVVPESGVAYVGKIVCVRTNSIPDLNLLNLLYLERSGERVALMLSSSATRWLFALIQANEDSWVQNHPDRTRDTAPIWTHEVKISRHPGPSSSVVEYKLRILGEPSSAPSSSTPSSAPAQSPSPTSSPTTKDGEAPDPGSPPAGPSMPPTTDPEILRLGTPVWVVNGPPAEVVDEWVRMIARDTDLRMDWHHVPGRGEVVLVIGDRATCDLARQACADYMEILRRKHVDLRRWMIDGSDVVGDRVDQEPEAPAGRQVITHDDSNGEVAVSLSALHEECARVIAERPRDGSPPMVAISADVLRAVAWYAMTLSDRIVGADWLGPPMRITRIKELKELKELKDLALRRPVVGGDGAADASGAVVHPIHASAVHAADQVSAPPTPTSPQVMRGLVLLKGHFDDDGHDWTQGTEMADVEAALAWIARSTGRP
jgi:hypothetical protein